MADPCVQQARERLIRQTALEIGAEIAVQRMIAAEERVAALETALRKYGDHKTNCEIMLPRHPCSCGYAAALAGSGTEPAPAEGSDRA